MFTHLRQSEPCTDPGHHAWCGVWCGIQASKPSKPMTLNCHTFIGVIRKRPFLCCWIANKIVLNVYVSPTFMCWNPNPKVMVIGSGHFGRWLGHQGRAFMSGISALINEAPVSVLALFTMWGYRENLWPGRGSSPYHAGTPISDFQPPELWDINLHCF